MTAIAGIDPGVSGAVAIIQAGRFVAGIDMPTFQDGKRRRVNAAALAAFLSEHRPARVILERVGAMPGQGVASMFSFGHSVGIAEGVATALGLPLVLVTPQAWKRAAGLIGSDKAASLAVAARLFPDAPLSRKKDVALADALLIASYGTREARAA